MRDYNTATVIADSPPPECPLAIISTETPVQFVAEPAYADANVTVFDDTDVVGVNVPEVFPPVTETAPIFVTYI